MENKKIELFLIHPVQGVSKYIKVSKYIFIQETFHILPETPDYILQT